MNMLQVLRSVVSASRNGASRRLGILLLLGIVIIAPCGCDIQTRLKPMPVIYGPGRVDLGSIIPETHRTRDLQVFYATNRKPHGPTSRPTYGNEVDASLH